MAQGKKKRKFKWGRICFWVLVVFFAVEMISAAGKLNDQKSEIAQKQDELDAIQLENKELQEQKAVAGTEEYDEYMLRTKLGMLKEDEVKYSVAD